MQERFCRAVSRPIIMVLLGLVLSSGPSGAAQNSPISSQVRSFNNHVLQIAEYVQSAPASQVSAVRAQAVGVFQQRAAALRSLIEQDPAEALRLAFSRDVLARLARTFPTAVSHLEVSGEWEGPVETIVEDDKDMKTRSTFHRLSSGGMILDVHFAGTAPTSLACGRIRFKGIRVGTQLAAADGSVELLSDPTSPAACSSQGQQRSIVLMVNMPGTTPPAVTTAAVWDMFFASTGRSLNQFWRETSYGVTSAAGDVMGWYTLDANYYCGQSSEIRAAAIRAADSAVDFTQYSRIFLIVAGAQGTCEWAGMSTVGCSTLSSNDGSFNASTSWMIADYFANPDQGVKLAIHEAGHGLGLNHAASRDFGVEALGAPGAYGTVNEYGDVFSAMGLWNLGHYAAPHKARLGWMSSDIQTVTSSGSFSVQPTEMAGNLHALRIRRGNDDSKWIWLEYRNPIGNFDSTLNGQVFSGALIHYEDGATGSYSHVLDFTPATASWNDPALAAAQTWADPYSDLSISVTSATATALNVSVAYGSTPSPCMESSPTVTISPANPDGYPGDTINYTVSVTNNDSATCVTKSFTLSSVTPAGWPTAFSQGSLTIEPGASASTSMSKAIPTNTAAATYPVTVTATSGGFSGGASVDTTVKPAPLLMSVNLSVSPGPYRRPSTIPITAMVTNAPGVVVTFTVQTPGGSIVRGNVPADSTGKAVWNYKVVPKDHAGQYTAYANVTSNGQSVQSNAASFSVR